MIDKKQKPTTIVREEKRVIIIKKALNKFSA
jgi:hypothetical protein